MFEILHDIKSGALPAEELPSFGAWLLRKELKSHYLKAEAK